MPPIKAAPPMHGEAESGAGSGRSVVQALERGLDILFVLQQYNGLTVAELVERVRLPRSTIVRMLETLAELGYVALSSGDRKYRPLGRTEELARGFSPDRRMREAAARPLAAFAEKEGWTIAIAALHGLTMVVEQVATPRLAIDPRRLLVGMRTPLLDTAVGLIALSYAPVEHLFKLLEAGEADVLARQSGTAYAAAEIGPALTAVRARGWAAHTTHDATYIAVPLLLTDDVIRAVSVRLCGVNRLPAAETQIYAAKTAAVAEAIRTAFAEAAPGDCSHSGDGAP